MLKKQWIVVLAFLVVGCASLDQKLNPSGPVSEEEIFNARADQAPVIIYSTSFSHGAETQQPTELTVRFINVSAKQIDAITLLVVSCMAAGGQDQGGYAALPMKGPFAPSGVFESHPSVDASAGWTSRQTSQMMIKAADVLFQDGSKQSFTGKDISKLFGNQLSNYCAAVSGTH